MGSVAVAVGTAFLANGIEDKMDFLEEVQDILVDSEVKNKIAMAIDHIDLATDHFEALALIGSGGYVPETVGAAFYCFGVTDNFKDAVVLAVKA
jgi:ADP-ribosylglycohydrolase